MKKHLLKPKSLLLRLVILAIGALLSAVIGSTAAQAGNVTVSGRIVAPDGSALAQASGWVQMDPQESDLYGRGGNIQEDGSFSIEDVTPGQYSVRVEYQGSENYCGAAQFNVTISAIDTNLGDIKVSACNLIGYLIDKDGNRIWEEIGVNVDSFDNSFHSWSGLDDQGNFKFGGLPAGKYTLRVNVPQESEYTNTRVDFEITNAAQEKDLGAVQVQLPNLKGRVVASDGSVLTLDWEQNQRVDIMLNNDELNYHEGTGTDEEGNFKFGGLQTGTYRLEMNVWGLDYTPPATQYVELTSDVLTDEGDIRLSTPMLVGTVTDPAGQPVNNVNIEVHNQDWSIRQSGHTNEDGYYAVGGLASGKYLSQLHLPWDRTDLIAPNEEEITLTEGSVLTHDIQIPSAVKFIEVTVTREDGVPIKANVNANKEGGGGWAGNETDPKTGKTTLSVSAGSWYVRAEHPWDPSGKTPDWLPTASRQSINFKNDGISETKSVNLVVYKTDASLIGKLVLVDNTPLIDIDVNANTEDGANVHTRTTSNGTFKLNLRSGSYRVNFWDDRQDLAFSEFNVSIKSGETKDLGTLIIPQKKARIAGVVTDKKGVPLEGIWLNAFKHGGQEWSNVQTQSDGTFSLPVLGKGRYGVNIDQGRNDSKYVYAEGKPLEIEVPKETSIVDMGKIKLTFADVTITGFIIDTETSGVVLNFWSWVEAMPDATTTIGDWRQSFGGPVNGGDGSFSIRVPSSVATSYTLTAHTPPNAEYSMEKEKHVAVWTDATITADVSVRKNNATIRGQLVDQNNQLIQNCPRREDRWFGDVHADKPDQRLWRNAEIKENCAYELSLTAGEWNIGYWIEHGNGFMSQPPKPDPIEIKEGENIINLKAVKGDSEIKITVVDPAGELVKGKMWAHAGNWRELEEEKREVKEKEDENKKESAEEESKIKATSEEKDEKEDEDEDIDKNKEEEDKKEEDKKDVDLNKDDWNEIRDKEMQADTEIIDGLGTITLLSGHIWEINIGIPSDLPYIAPSMQEVNLKTATSGKDVTFVLETASGQMNGTVSMSNVPVNQGFVWCNQENQGTDKGGSFSGGQVEWEGKYALNYGEGLYRCGADSFVGREFWRAEEELINTFGQSSIEKDWSLGKLNFEVPDPVTKTFDATTAQVISLGNNEVIINIPAGAIAAEGNITVTAEPTVDGLMRNYNTKPFGVGYDLTALDESGTEITDFVSQVMITFSYTDEQIEEFGLDISGLTGVYVDSATNTYQSPSGVSHQRNEAGDGGTITLSATHFTTFLIASTGKGIEGGAAISGPYNLIATAAKDGGPQVGVYTKDGQLLATWFAYPAALRLGMEAFAVDLDGNGEVEVVTYPTQGFPSQIRVFNKNGSVLSQFFAYDTGYKDGINVTAFDLDNDGETEIITSPATNASADIRVYNRNGGLLAQFNAYGDGYTLGAGVAAADLNGDGTGEIVTYPQAGSGQVRVFNTNGNVLAQFNTYGDTYRNGINLTMADMDGNGTVEIITGTKNTVPQVKTFDANGNVLNQFYGYAETFLGGVVPEAGDVDGDGASELILLPGTDGAAQARVFNKDGGLLSQFFGYPTHIRGSFEIVLGDLDGNGVAEIVFAPQEGLGPQARVFNKDGNALSQFFTLHTGFRGGIHLGLIAQ